MLYLFMNFIIILFCSYKYINYQEDSLVRPIFMPSFETYTRCWLCDFYSYFTEAW